MAATGTGIIGETQRGNHQFSSATLVTEGEVDVRKAAWWLIAATRHGSMKQSGLSHAVVEKTVLCAERIGYMVVPPPEIEASKSA